MRDSRGGRRFRRVQGPAKQPREPQGSLPAPCPSRSAWAGGSGRWTWRRYLGGGDPEARGTEGRDGAEPGRAGLLTAGALASWAPAGGAGRLGSRSRQPVDAPLGLGRAGSERLRTAPPPTPGWAVLPFGPAELLRLLFAAAAGRLLRSSPALSGTAPRPAHRQPPPDLLLPTWPPPPPVLGSFRRQETETSEASRNWVWGGAFSFRLPTGLNSGNSRRMLTQGTHEPPVFRRTSFGSIYGNPRSDSRNAPPFDHAHRFSPPTLSWLSAVSGNTRSSSKPCRAGHAPSRCSVEGGCRPFPATPEAIRGSGSILGKVSTVSVFVSFRQFSGIFKPLNRKRGSPVRVI